MSASGSSTRQFFLRIERGRTRHPERPIEGERFLIGGGSNCDLQLGGDVPIVHSVIIQTENGLWIDAISKNPQLLVNRQPIREGELVTGDLIEIGTFIFVVQERILDMEVDFTENEQVNIRDLTAEDIVDLLAAEIRDIEEAEAARAAGARALLDRAAQADSDELPRHPATDIATDVELLKQRAAQLDEREALVAEKAAHLQKAQDRLAAYLENLQSQSHEPRVVGDNDETIRKTA